MREYGPVIAKTAAELNLLGRDGALLKLDSLAMIDFVIALERALKIKIPSASISSGTFDSLQSVEQMIAACVEA